MLHIVDNVVSRKVSVMSQQYPERLREHKFRQDQPKRVDYSQLWVPPSELVVPTGSDAEKDLLAIIRAIRNGYLVPNHCYRPGVDDNEPPDRLLAEKGIKHLHLGGRKSDVLLFLVEYETFVLLLDIKGHGVFQEEPPGSLLASLHHNALRRADALSVTERIQAAAERATNVAKAAFGLLPRKRRD